MYEIGLYGLLFLSMGFMRLIKIRRVNSILGNLLLFFLENGTKFYGTKEKHSSFMSCNDFHVRERKGILAFNQKIIKLS